MDDVVEERPLKLYFLPYPASGHMIPMSDIARFFASRGQHVTIITTPSNAKYMLPTTTRFHVHTFPFPSSEVGGLPDGVENLAGVTDLENSYRIYHATLLLRESIENFVEQNPPDCIVADFLYPWVDDLANKLRIPRFAFNGFSLFAICAMEAVKPLSLDATGSFVIPDFPHQICINSPPPKDSRIFMEPLFDVAFKSNGFIINSFAELDGEEYIEYYQKRIGHKAWHLGPACLISKTVEEKTERGNQSVLNSDECLSWLNSKRDNSVVYISFGTMCYFTDKQLYEIACGLEASNHEFVWVVPEKTGKENESLEEKEKWLPKGFEERNGNKGMIIRGWAPQVLILSHRAVGAFVTHCGWNSTVEAVSAGVPTITWPVHGEQFYNEKLISELRGIGVEVGAEGWRLSGFRDDEIEKVVVTRDKIEKAVRRLMDGSDEAEEIRRRARQFGKKARQAVQEGGSSYNNLTALIHHLKRLRDSKPLD